MLWLISLTPVAAAAIVFALRPRSRTLLAFFASLSLAVTVALVVLATTSGWSGLLRWSVALALHAKLTPLSALVAAFVPTIALPVLVYAAWREHATGLPRLLGLLLLFCGGMELVVIADDLLVLLMGWEIIGACSWALIAHQWRETENPHAARYAFAVTRFGDLGLFVAASAAYAGAGSFAFTDLARLDAAHLQIVAFGILMAAASKSGQLPFAPWLFRAMAGPTSASALLHAATMVAAGAYLLARLQPVLASVPGFATGALAIGAATALAGGVVAAVQADVKKVLAASTSAHFGLMFMAVGAGFPGIAVWHLLAHGSAKAMLFLSAGIAIDRSGSHRLSDMLLGLALPVVAALAAVGAAALAGLPPLGAGWTKEAIVAAAAATAPGWAAVAIVVGGLSATYSVRWLWMAYGFRDAHSGDANSGNASGVEGSGDNRFALAPVVTVSLGALALACLLLSALWFPDVRSLLARASTLRPAPESTWLFGATLATLAAGALAGRWLALRRPQLGTRGPEAQVADWWRLPALIDLTVAVPVASLAGALAQFDDRVVDAVARAIGRRGRSLASTLAGIDKRVVDGGVRAATAFVEWLSHAVSRVGELVADGVALGPARLVALGAEDARRLQTGLSHQAFALLLFGALALGALLLAAGL